MEKDMMPEATNLMNDIEEALQNKKPPYLEKRARLDPDNLLYRATDVIPLLLSEIEDLRSEVKDLEYEISDLERWSEEKD
jgi:hypothetical protein